VRSFLLGLWRRLRGTPGSAPRAAAAVAIGLFIGCQPLFGLHLVLVLAVCVPLRLDAVLSYLAANISNPFFAPFLIFSEVEAGAYLMSGRFVAFDVAHARAAGAAGFARYLLAGSLAVGAALAAVGFAVSWLAANRRSPRDPDPSEMAFNDAVDRTLSRYRTAAVSDRYYVAGKLAFDPMFRPLADLMELGRVLDLGCGRGQLVLLLLELGLATHATGVDSDARKIEVARTAGPDAHFEVADLMHAELPPADTILLIDVLHYLPVAEQDALLQSALEALSPGGRVIVRELDAEPSAKGAATRVYEWIVRKIGLNRGRATAYRPARHYVELLQSAGLSCSVQGASESTPFANVLIVAGGSPSVKVEPPLSAPSTRVSAAKA
jgi:SAM-dependent methyltransferase/uncharacterized protein (DUF2062 family)